MAEELRISNPEAKGRLIARLGRVEGQIRGLQEMLEREEECEQIAQQISAARAAFDKVFAEMIADELEAVEATPSRGRNRVQFHLLLTNHS